LNDPGEPGGGTILHTTDGGMTWTPQASGTTATLDDVYFVDATQGWAVGGKNNDTPGVPSGIILHTTDGGTTWTTQHTTTGHRFWSVHFVDAATGWASGDFGMIAKTTDGGATWESQIISAPDGSLGPIKDVQFIDANRGWAIGSAYVLGTTDGGATWPIGEPVDIGPHALFFTDANQGWVAGGLPGGAGIFHTTDGGATWQAQSIDLEQGFVLNDLFFVDAHTGWVVGASDTSLILTTAGSGSSVRSQLYLPLVLNRSRPDAP
jgi:photosystem II stability/assembly factor-like uncharacterized protein